MSDRLTNRIKRVRKLLVANYQIIDCTGAKDALLASFGGSGGRSVDSVASGSMKVDKKLLQGLKSVLQAEIRCNEERFHARFASYSTDKEKLI